MTARGALYTLINEDPVLRDIGLQAVYHADSVDTPEEDVFVVIRMGVTDKAFGVRGTQRFAIWAYHRSAEDYGTIDLVLSRIKDLVPDAVHRGGPDGWTLTSASWQTDGPDLKDEGYNSITRWSEFTMSSRRT